MTGITTTNCVKWENEVQACPRPSLRGKQPKEYSRQTVATVKIPGEPLTMMTARDFIDQRHELPDGGRWTELVAGKPLVLEPPDQKHGDVVFNVSHRLAESLSPQGEVYAGFDVGIRTRGTPDTIRFPAVSVFTRGNRFAQVDSMLAEDCPSLVMEVVSSNDRRTTIAERVYEYHHLGVEKVWVIDPIAEQVTVLKATTRAVTFSESERLSDLTLLPGFEVATRDLFSEPSWWRG